MNVVTILLRWDVEVLLIFIEKALYMNSKRQFSEKEFSEAIAEWVDGDMLSAHYAIGNDFLYRGQREKCWKKFYYVFY